MTFCCCFFFQWSGCCLFGTFPISILNSMNIILGLKMGTRVWVKVYCVLVVKMEYNYVNIMALVLFLWVQVLFQLGSLVFVFNVSFIVIFTEATLLKQTTAMAPKPINIYICLKKETRSSWIKTSVRHFQLCIFLFWNILNSIGSDKKEA